MITLGLIGRGRWGSNIRRTLEQLPGCQLKYVETRGWKRLVSARDLGGVLIATPGSTHAEIALPFIERGIPTFIEKPLTTSLRDALRLQRAAEKSGALVFVGHVHLYSPAYRTAKKLARHAGRIRFLTAEGMNNGPYREDMSALWDWAPHDLAMVLDLLGESPRAVQASGLGILRPRTRLYDAATLRLEFPSGVQFLGIYSWMAQEKRKRFVIHGSLHTIVYDDVAERKVTV
ncbi:MAG: oxidoreductase [Parcubacteria group bacterium Gr01-1014_38]|nr:MAG: oxidoreductase [Parcubacteria group bacterium Gr01-1014_38]